MTETSIPAPRTHALLGSSGMYRAMNCTGSIFLTKEMPEAPTSAAASEGTIFHDLCERRSRQFLEGKVDGLSGKPIDFSPFPEEMSVHVDAYIDLLWKNVFAESATGKAWGFEEQFWLDEKLDMGGYEDFYCVQIDDRGNRRLDVVDIKYGFKLVHAKDNPQLAFLICAIREEALKRGKDFDYAYGHIFQPRAYGKETWDTVKFTAKQLDKWREKFFKTAEDIFVTKKPRFKVGEWCEYCRGKPVCTLHKERQEKNLSLDLVQIKTVKLPQVDKIPDNQLSKIALNADDIISFVKAVKAHCMERGIAGKKVPGLKVVEGRGRREWKDEKTVDASLLELGFEKGDLYNKKLKGIIEIEKLLEKEFGKDEATTTMKKLVVMSVPPALLVPEEDARPELESVVNKLKRLTK